MSRTEEFLPGASRWKAIADRLWAGWLGLSLVALLAFNAFGLKGPTSSLRDCADQQSHVASAVAFPSVGFDLYRRPTAELLRPKGDGSVVDGYDGRPLYFNWTEFPRPYPPGAFLFAAPEAILYQFTNVDFTWLNRFSNIKFLLAATWLSWLLWQLLQQAQSPQASSWAAALWILAAGWLSYVLWAESMRWALSGFYDALPIALVCLSVLLMQRKALGFAALSYSLAIFMHFRALWYAPMLAVLVLNLFAARRTLFGSDWLKLGIAVIFSVVSAVTFWLVSPWLRQFPLTNHMILADSYQTTVFFVVLILIVLLMLLWRKYLFVCCLLWQLTMALQAPQVMPWHVLFLTPLLFLATAPQQHPSSRAQGALLVATATIYLESVFIFGNQLAPKLLWRAIYQHLTTS